MRLKLALCGVALVLSISACTSSHADSHSGASATAGASGAASPPAWTEPAKYGFVLERQCNRGPSMGRYRVAVENGKVVTAERIDGKTAVGEEEIEVPSLSGLLDLAQTAADDGGEVTTSRDPVDGHPTAVSFNVSDEGTDGASCFLVSDYAVTP